MKEKVNLILDGQSHKAMINYNGKLSKLTIGSIYELSLPAARLIIQEINELLRADYGYEQIATLLEVAELYPMLSKYSRRSLKVLSKLKSEIVSQEEKVESFNTKKPTVVLNIGCTASGKTKFNISSVVTEEFRKGFAALSSIKESTNWTVGYEINHPERGIVEGFEIEIELKEEEQIKNSISLQILESIQEIFSQIEKLLSAKQVETIAEEEIWICALEAGFQRLKVNKDKTFDISHLVLSDEIEINAKFRELILKGIREFSTTSTSYDGKLSDEQLVKTLISNYQESSVDFKLEQFFAFIQENKEYEELLENLLRLVQESLKKFKKYYKLEGNHQKIVLKEKFNIKANKELIKSVFGCKRGRSDEDYFSIEILVKKATFYFINKDIDESKHTILYDGLGINQGQLDNEKDIALKRVNKAIFETKPDLIIYHTRLESKDNLLVNVMNELEVQGYKGRLYIVFGRADVVLKQYCEEDDLDLASISKNELIEFDDFVKKEYISKDLISLVDDYEERTFICDKTANLKKDLDKVAQEAIEKYLPQSILNNIIKHYNEANQQTREKINNEKAERILRILDEKQVFSSVYSDFTNEVQNSIPMEYQKLRWNTLECVLRELSYGYLGFGNIYPTIDLKRAYAENLNIEELADYLGEDYNEFLREFLEQFMEVSNSLIITINKSEYIKLFNLRFNVELRNMKALTITDERKTLLKSTFLTSLENDKVVGAASIRNITKNVLESMII